MIGGMVSSTVLTFLVIPAIYALVKDRGFLVERALSGIYQALRLCRRASLGRFSGVNTDGAE